MHDDSDFDLLLMINGGVDFLILLKYTFNVSEKYIKKIERSENLSPNFHTWRHLCLSTWHISFSALPKRSCRLIRSSVTCLNAVGSDVIFVF